MSRIDALKHLWDGTEDWVLRCTYHSQIHLTVVFENSRPSIQEIESLRMWLEEFRKIPVSQIRERIGEIGKLDIGTFSSMEAQNLLLSARKLNLKVIETDTSRTSYLPVTRAGNVTCLIEDEALMQEVTRRMMEAGVSVVPAEDD